MKFTMISQFVYHMYIFNDDHLSVNIEFKGYLLDLGAICSIILDVLTVGYILLSLVSYQT